MNIQFLGQQYNTGELIRKRRGIKIFIRKRRFEDFQKYIDA